MTDQNLQTTDPKSLDEAALEKAALHHINHLRIHGRNMVVSAWNAGQYLTEMKHRIEHGEWTKWLESNSIHDRLAQRCIKIGEIPGPDVAHFNTLEEAYRSIKQIASPPDHPEIQDQPIPLTAAEKRIVEMDKLRQEAAHAGQQLTEERAKREEAERVSAAFQSRSSNEEGFEEDRSIINQERERTKQHTTRIKELQDENKELQIEAMALKRVIKTKEARIRTLEEMLELNPDCVV